MERLHLNPDRYRALLLTECLPEEEAAALLLSVGLDDWRSADRILQAIAGAPAEREAFAEILPELMPLLRSAGDPLPCLARLERFTASVGSRLSFFHTLASNPRSVEALVRLFDGSHFLTEALLRDPDYFSLLSEPSKGTKAEAVLEEQLHRAVAVFRRVSERLNALRRFQRRELLRIGTSDLLGELPVHRVARELSILATRLVCEVLAQCWSGMETLAALPLGFGFLVVALGKLGAMELNYSSDIDLLFLCSGDEELQAAYSRLGELVIKGLEEPTSEGYLYRVDMRLRPYGASGPLVPSLRAYRKYLAEAAGLWEKQALLRARVIAGDPALAAEFTDWRFRTLLDASCQPLANQIRRQKDRIEEATKRPHVKHIKLGVGGIRDIEFLAQFLQLAHLGAHPDLLDADTTELLQRLASAGLLSKEDLSILAPAYTFFRQVEHRLQMMHDLKRHELPRDKDELKRLALRLGYAHERTDQFLLDYNSHAGRVRDLFDRFLPPVAEPPGRSEMPDLTKIAAALAPEFGAGAVETHLRRLGAAYVSAFSIEEMAQHLRLLGQVRPDRPVAVEATRVEAGAARVTVVGYDYLGELSIICGLFTAHGVSIQEGRVFTYAPVEAETQPSSVSRTGTRRRLRPGVADKARKIVDAFTVAAPPEADSPTFWAEYERDLLFCVGLLRARRQREARGEVAKKVAANLRPQAGESAPLLPVTLFFDNETSPRHTVLEIRSTDTVGFLYELTNALAMCDVHIDSVAIRTEGTRIVDTLHVTTRDGAKISDPKKQIQIRTATVLIKHFTHLLPYSPNPEAALLHFGDLLADILKRPQWAMELASFERREVLDALTQLLGVSDFLWEDFLRLQHENLFPLVTDTAQVAARRTRAEMEEELKAAVAEGPDFESKRAALNQFKDREMFRTDMRHILGHTPNFNDFSAEMSDLAEALVSVGMAIGEEELTTKHGAPVLESGEPCLWTLLALGKFGGRELGYASDIELMLVYAGPGQTTGDAPIPTARYFAELVTALRRCIRAKRRGIFEVDLQLRPHGKNGPLAATLDAFCDYYSDTGEAWDYERQALVKLRPAAGDCGLAARLLAARDRFVYSNTPLNLDAVFDLRRRQVAELVMPGTINAKFSPGGLVDVEYLVQLLQIQYGARHHQVRSPNTLQALEALRGLGAVTEPQFCTLGEAYDLLRRTIEALRVVRGNAQDLALPSPESEEFEFLALRLRLPGEAGSSGALGESLATKMREVRELQLEILGRSV